MLNTLSKRRTGYVFDEWYMWHDSGSISFTKFMQPGPSQEDPETKRRIHNLIQVSGLYDKLIPIKARHATKEQILLFHTEKYHNLIMEGSLQSKGSDGGEQCRFGFGGYEIATLSCGGVLNAIDAVLDNTVDNAYCLVRPPGHHAIADKGMGFCIFNNIVIGAKYLRTLNRNIHRVAIVDYDVHHGNGTQEAFWDDNNTLFISLHQDNNYPQGCGTINEIGSEKAKGTTINIPLPPGSGSGAYYYAFDKVVIPALEKFQPDFILVSSGFDPSYADRLAAMMLSSEAFANITQRLMDAANKLCNGKIVFCHEGGYSPDYVPYCGLAVLEELSGFKTQVTDPYLTEVSNWGYQSLQSHQKLVVDKVITLLDLQSDTFVNEIQNQITKDIENQLSLVNDKEIIQHILSSLQVKYT